MNLHFVRSAFALPLALALPATAAAAPAPTPVPITVQLGGQTFVGNVAPTTRTATGAGLDVPADAIRTIPGGPAPLAVHLDAMDVLDPADLRDVRVTWGFGDPDGRRNVLEGYNAAHTYDAPGTYLITRVVDAPSGRTLRGYRVTVTADARRPVHVSLDGDDAGDGRTPETAVRTWARAAALVRPNTNVLLRRGDRFPVDRTLEAKGDDVRIAPYGDPALPAPVLALSVPRNDFPMIRTQGARTVVEGITFDSDATGGPEQKAFEKKNVVDGIGAGGRGLLVRGCTFRNICNAINGNGSPEGVLLQDNDAPLETGVRAYLAWVEGVNWTILDNHAVNSTREHIVRVGGGERVNITGNRFRNMDRRDEARGGDGGDFSKSTLNIQKGRVAWVAQNVLRDGPISCGPLGGGDGKNQKESRWVGATFENNRVYHNEFQVQHGARGITYRNNFVEQRGLTAFSVYDYSAEYGRGCVDVTIVNNTAVNNDTTGNFVRVGAAASGVRLIRNLYVAPRLITGSHATGPVYVQDANTEALTAVEGNRWPEPAQAKGEAAKAGGPFLIGGGYTATSRWLEMAPTDKVTAIPSGTLTLDEAGVDVLRLPPPPAQEQAGDAGE